MIRNAYRLFCAILFVMAILVIAHAKSSGAEETTKKEPTVNDRLDDGATPKDVAIELEKRRSEILKKENEVAEYEKKVKDQEAAIQSKIKDLEALRAAINGDIETKKKDNEERVTKLVTVFETMAPKASAAILETTDDTLAVEVLKRMDIKRMAKIMNTMDKSRSAKLSELMTGYIRPDRLVKQQPAPQAPVAAATPSQTGREVASAKAVGQGNQTPQKPAQASAGTK